MIGTVLGKFEVLEKIGEGGMATVYLGRHTTLGREAAVKVLHPHLSSSTRNRKRFAREARAIEHLRHDNILEIFDYSGTSASECYIITEFVDGETLTQLLNRSGRMPSEVTAMVGLSLARALEYAHQRGVLHRDLKPDNVMVRSDGTIKLMDFGIARFLDESQVTMTGALVGSPAFMSPEQARESDLDPRSDLFSLGTLLFYLVTGHLPFSGSNPSLILKNIIENNRPMAVELSPTVSATLADTIERLLQPDREERFDSATQVVEALKQVLAEGGVDSTEPGWGLLRYRQDPDAYRDRLEEHLSTFLLDQGQALLAQGDHLSALRLLNRLLAMDEDNAEVLALVQGLHAEHRPRRGMGVFALIAVIIAVVAGIVWMIAGPGPEEAEPAPLPEPSISDSPLEPEVVPPEESEVEVLPDMEEARPSPVIQPVVSPASKAVVPPTVIRPRTLPAAPEAKYGILDLRIKAPGYADVFLDDGTRVGRTRESPSMPVPVGTYEVELRSDAYYTHKVPVVIDPGETFTTPVIVLEPRPAGLVVPDGYEDSCELMVNGQPKGTLAELGHEIPEVLAPEGGNLVQLTCPETERQRSFELPTIEANPTKLEYKP